MASFRYQALNGAGKAVTGSLEAQSLDHANDQLASRGLAPLAIEEEAAAAAPSATGEKFRRLFNTVKAEELILFTKQFGSMLHAGIPLLRVVDILESQADNPRLKDVCRQVAADIRAGANLNTALRKHSDVFSPLYASMILAGESSGALPQILQRLIYILSHEQKIRSDIRSALQYPILVLVVLVSAFVTLITFVIPKFVGIYKQARIELPMPTRVCIQLSKLFNEHWLPLVLAIVAISAGFYLTVRTKKGRLWLDRLKLQIPLIGPLILKASLSRFASIFSILQSSGVGILDSIHILTGTIGNTAIGEALEQVQSQLEKGHGIARPLAAAKYFTPMFINMVAVGEEAGNLSEMLQEISLHYDAEVEFATKRLTTAIGPFLIVTLAGMVGFFALAVYMPMWDLTKLAKQH